MDIINGSGELWAGQWLGGGINCDVNAGSGQAELTLNNVSLSANNADVGAALFAENCDISITNSDIAHNVLGESGKGAAIHIKDGDLFSDNNDYRHNSGGHNSIEAIDSEVSFHNDLLMNNNHEDATMVIGGNAGHLATIGSLENVQFIDNDSTAGAAWIRTGSELSAVNIDFNGNSLYEVVTDEIDYYIEPLSDFDCANQLSGAETKLRCGNPMTASPQYATHLDTHYATDIQFHSALMTIPEQDSPNIDSIGLKTLDSLIPQCRTDFSIHLETNGGFELIWSETVNQGNAIPSSSPRILRSSAIDLPFSGGETLLFGVVISNCTGTAFESPQNTNTYGNRLIWDQSQHIGPSTINSDRSFDSQDLGPGMGGAHIGFQIHLTDET